MKKYLSFFRLHFIQGLQYRSAAIAGMTTQLVWGLLTILAFGVFYKTDPASYPMTFAASVTYIYLQQAFLALFNFWVIDQEIFNSIINGNIAYEFCRPIHIYPMWYSKNLAIRLSSAALRCFPILIIGIVIPSPYNIAAPPTLFHFMAFIISLLLGLGVNVALIMLIYGFSFYTISPQGLRVLFVSLSDFCAGAILPLPFFPDKLRHIMELLPFASTLNAPLMIYNGSMTLTKMYFTLALQLFWFITLVFVGLVIFRVARKRFLFQGG